MASVSSKAGEQLARRIAQDIIELGWPPRHRLGSLIELTQRYNVGKAALREGVRLLEQRGTVCMRPGPGGGLFVAGGADASVVQLLATHLQYVRVSCDEIEETWQLFDELMIRHAARRMTGDLREALQISARRLQYESDQRRLLEIDDAFRASLADLSGNSAVHLMVQSLNALHRCMLREAAGDAMSDDMCNVLRQSAAAIARALANADVEGAIAAAADSRGVRFAMLDTGMLPQPEMRTAAPLESLYMQWVRAALELATASTDAARRAESAALAMAQGIARFGLPVGTALGSAATLRAGIGVSEAVFREAVRLLELHGVIVTVAGRQGGLQVGAPSSGRVLDAAIAYLRHLGFGAMDYGAVRETLNVGAARLAARRVTGSERRELLRLAARKPPADFNAFWGELDDFQQMLSRCAHNRVLALLHALATRLVAHILVARQADEAWVQQRFREVTNCDCLTWTWQSHGRIYQAIADGRAEAAVAGVEQHYAIGQQVWLDQSVSQQENRE
jgi:DNA-binding FadR family transcriptional regulator